MFFINNCDSFCTFNDLIIRFSEKHVDLSHPIISEFVEMKLKNYDQLMEYFHHKLELGRKSNYRNHFSEQI